MRSLAGPVDRGVVKSARSGSAVSVARARQLRLFDQLCAWCDRPVLASRVDARYCSTRCRQAAYRAGVRRAELAATAVPLRLAYADPPYPGKSGLYRGQPHYAGEVDLEELLWAWRRWASQPVAPRRLLRDNCEETGVSWP
jgi:hypothetical protein